VIRTVILGLLRDGAPRHGYELMVAHRARSGEQLNTGNFYRELARLSSEGLVETGVNPPDADARRIPYRITPRGSTLFDEWLISLQVHDDEEISERLLFVDLIPAETRTRLLERWQEELWVRGKILTRARGHSRWASNGRVERYDPCRH
jgi:DNA-binding PadR family transcriptional regulator